MDKKLQKKALEKLDAAIEAIKKTKIKIGLSSEDEGRIHNLLREMINVAKILKDMFQPKEEPEEPYDPNWRAHEEGGYWFIDEEFNRLSWKKDIRGDYDKSRWLSGNYFMTREQAKRKLEYDKALMRIKRYIRKNFGHFEPDWEDPNQKKFYIFYCNQECKLERNYCGISQDLNNLPYLQTEQQCNQLIKDMEEDLKIVLNYNQ